MALVLSHFLANHTFNLWDTGTLVGHQHVPGIRLKTNNLLEEHLMLLDYGYL